jgi:aminoglycoside 3-N-acetyltransferase
VAGVFLREECTLLVPTFSWRSAAPPLVGRRPARNGCDYDHLELPLPKVARHYQAGSSDVDEDMGVMARTILAMPGHHRSGHPLCSFAAIGSLAGDLIPDSLNLDLCAPLNNLCAANGSVLLLGVDLTSMTLVHVAEKLAGRNLFRRWARTNHGVVEVEVGGCSEGFMNLESTLQPFSKRASVGSGMWTAFVAEDVLHAAARAVRADAAITHCEDSACGRCDDAVRGGPQLP